MAEKMVRTQVYLPQDTYTRLKQRADAEGITMAHQIREALAAYITKTEAEDKSGFVIADDDPIWNMIGMVKTGLSDASVNHDKYIYVRDWDVEPEE